MNHTLADFRKASKAWRDALCGPVALSAILGIGPRDVLRLIPEVERVGWISLELMQTAFTRAKRRHWRHLPIPHGVAVLHFDGPWKPLHESPSHWVAISGGLWFDSFSMCWCDKAHWMQHYAPQVAARIKPGANGKWWMQWGVEVER